MSTPHMTLLLNRAEAVIDCKAGSMKELCDVLGKPPSQVSTWLRARSCTPNGEVAMMLFQWVTKKTLQIAMAGKPLRGVYRTKFDELMAKWPAQPKGIEI